MSAAIEKQQVICARCGYAEEHEDPGVYAHAKYPSRQVWVPTGEFGMPEAWRCPECSNKDDVILFGKAFIAPMMLKAFGARYMGELDVVQRSNAFFYQTSFGKPLPARLHLPPAA